MGIRERVAGDGKWTGIWHMVGVDGQKFSWTYDELVQTLSKMFLMNNEKRFELRNGEDVALLTHGSWGRSSTLRSDEK